MMKLLGNTKSKVTKDENGDNVPHVEITEVVLAHCNIFDNDYQQDSRVLYTFAPNKSFDQLLDILPKNFIFLKLFNSEFPYIEVCFTDQNSKPLEIEDKVNITLIINQSLKYKKLTIFFNLEIFIKCYVFLSFAKGMNKNVGKSIGDTLSCKYSQKLLDYAKQSATEALKTASKRATRKQQKQLVI